jgi:hypothetical protein
MPLLTKSITELGTLPRNCENRLIQAQNRIPSFAGVGHQTLGLGDSVTHSPFNMLWLSPSHNTVWKTQTMTLIGPR